MKKRTYDSLSTAAVIVLVLATFLAQRFTGLAYIFGAVAIAAAASLFTVYLKASSESTRREKSVQLKPAPLSPFDNLRAVWKHEASEGLRVQEQFLVARRERPKAVYWDMRFLDQEWNRLDLSGARTVCSVGPRLWSPPGSLLCVSYCHRRRKAMRISQGTSI